MTRPRIAIVGLGMAVTPHAQSYQDLADRVDVAYAFSPSAERRRAFAERFPFPLAESLEQILTDDSIDAVSLLTPPNTHLELTRRCVEAGKHVLLEKPLEITWGRSGELVEICRKSGAKLGVVLQHRFRPSGLRLREVLESGALGRIIGASASVLNWRPQIYYDEPGRGTKARDGGGVLLTQGIHTLDLFISLVDLPVEVFAYVDTSPVHRMETEDIVAAGLRFDNGALGTINATTAAYPGYPEEISLICEHGTAKVIGTSLEIRYHDGKEESLKAEEGQGGTGADPMAFPPDYHRALIADFLEAIDTDRAPRVTGEEALKVHRLIEAILESARTHQPVSLAGT
jgi:predicted dehydrogenase